MKINNHGRYTWKIVVTFEKDYTETVKVIKAIDQQLKQEFPDHVNRGNGRVATFEED